VSGPFIAKATVNTAMQGAIAVGGDLALGLACLAALKGVWPQQMVQVVHLELGAMLLTFGLWLAASPWRTGPRDWSDRVKLIVGVLALGSAIVWQLIASGGLVSRLIFVVLVAHRVVAAFRAAEVMKRSVFSVVLMLLFVGILAQVVGEQVFDAWVRAQDPWLVVGAIYFLTLTVIGSASRPAAARGAHGPVDPSAAA